VEFRGYIVLYVFFEVHMKPAIILTACGVGLALTVALTSCSTETQVVTPEQKVEVAGKGTMHVSVANVGQITQTYYPGKRPVCGGEKKDCYGEIVVEAERPKLTSQISNLDLAISLGTQHVFFQSPSNYSEIWSSMEPTVLGDLQNQRAFLVKIEDVPVDRRQYRVVDAHVVPKDYSGVN
jgi:hypothetical protein